MPSNLPLGGVKSRMSPPQIVSGPRTMQKAGWILPLAILLVLADLGLFVANNRRAIDHLSILTIHVSVTVVALPEITLGIQCLEE